MGEFNVNKSTGGLNPTAGMPETYPAEQVMLSDGVTSVEDALTANSLGTRVEITSHTQANPYTAPSDGYFLIYLHPGTSGYGCIESTACAIGGEYYDTDNTHNIRLGLYVRKGMHLFCTGSVFFAAFIPIS